MFRELLEQRLAGIVELTSAQIGILEAHYELLLRWNRVLNLTSIHRMNEAVERHYCESLFLGVHLPPGAWRIADIGSGAGFPGFPVAVLRPECSVSLIESHQRKAVFLREASRNIGNIAVFSKRAEEITAEFDCVVSRAVSYEGLAPALKELAPRVDLLTGAEEPPSSMGMIWDEAIALPWGERRFLRVGRREKSLA